MAIALLVGRDEHETALYNWFIEDITQQLIKFDSTLDIRIWPDLGTPDEVELALVWRHPFGALKKYPNLKCIASLGAGINHLTEDPELSNTIPIIRLMDPYMANDIVQYALTYVLHHIKRVEYWSENQKKNTWIRKPPFSLSNKTIGIMGMGFLGKKIALALQFIGLNVIGWSNSSKDIPGIKDFSGQKEFGNFLSQTDILICMLPLTSKTKHILNRDTFSQLRQDACLINIGRGDHLVEDDLIFFLDSGKLSTAYLDVFSQEPLPPHHPFWTHPKIHVTPHVASVTNPATAIPQLLADYYKLLAGEKITTQVDLAKGY